MLSHNGCVGSDFLFGMPSVLSGVARTLDLGATFDSYNESLNGAIADAKALYADWRTVGEALVEAAETVAPETRPVERTPELVEK